VSASEQGGEPTNEVVGGADVDSFQPVLGALADPDASRSGSADADAGAQRLMRPVVGGEVEQALAALEEHGLVAVGRPPVMGDFVGQEPVGVASVPRVGGVDEDGGEPVGGVADDVSGTDAKGRSALPTPNCAANACSLPMIPSPGGRAP